MTNDGKDCMRRLIELPAETKEYLGLAELAFVLGKSKQAISNMRRRGKLPEPLADLALGPVWQSRQIREFIEEATMKQRG